MKRPDFSGLREMARQSIGRSVVTAIVVANEDGGASSHYEIDADGRDVYVELRTVPGGQRMTARLGCVAGGGGMGVWNIPPQGAECVVLEEDGQAPRIVACLSSGVLPDLLVATPTAMVIQKVGGPLQIQASGAVSITSTGGAVSVSAQGSVDVTTTEFSNGNININPGGTGEVVLNGGSLDVARKTDAISVSADQMQASLTAYTTTGNALGVSGTITGGALRVKA